jgi:hypothetical protein
MAEYESRIIRGWRGALEDLTESVRERFWNAPAFTTYLPGIDAPRSDDVIGKPRWFRRVFGAERQAASDELLQLRKFRYFVQQAERTHEEREAKRMRDHQRYLVRRANQSIEGRQEQYSKARLRRAAQTVAEHEHELAICRQWRSKQSKEWREHQATMKRIRRLENPEMYKAIDKRTKDKNKVKARARRLVHRQENLKVIRARESVQKKARGERRRALACAQGCS